MGKLKERIENANELDVHYQIARDKGAYGVVHRCGIVVRGLR